MDFTREPIIESIVTPKEGCKLVVRSSKGLSQEEFFVDAVEMVSFGNTFFLRSLERPKAFLVPATDYEILEVRETKMVLKGAGLNRSIKIGGGRESARRAVKEAVKEVAKEEKSEVRVERKRERKRNYRKKKDREEEKTQGKAPTAETAKSEEKAQEPVKRPPRQIVPPPSTLISDTIERYKGNELFSEVFQTREVEKESPTKKSEIATEANESQTVEVIEPAIPKESIEKEIEPVTPTESVEKEIKPVKESKETDTPKDKSVQEGVIEEDKDSDKVDESST